MANAIKPLQELQSLQEGTIIAEKAGGTEFLRSLQTAGLTPNAFVRMLHNYGQYAIIEAGRRIFAIDKEMAAAISVLLL